MRFKDKLIKAERVQCPARIFLYGKPGSGKTFSALKLAKGLSYEIEDPLIVVFEPAENNRAHLIASEEGIPDYYIIRWDVSEDGILTHTHYLDFFKELLEWDKKPDVLIVDNITYLWEFVRELYENKGTAKYTHIKPEIQKTVKALFDLPMDWICTSRARFNWQAMTRRNDPELILEPQMEEAFEHLVDFAISIDRDTHIANITKPTPPSFDKQGINGSILKEEHGRLIKNWLKKGISASISNLVNAIEVYKTSLPEFYTLEVVDKTYEDLLTTDESYLELLVLKAKVLMAYDSVKDKTKVTLDKEVLLSTDMEKIKKLGKTYANANK